MAIGGRDYGAAGHRIVLMHPNKGLVIDLAAVRALPAARGVTRFRAACQNTYAGDPKNAGLVCEFWVFVDGEQRFSRAPMRGTDGGFDIDVELRPTDRYLTLVAADGGDDFVTDWLTLGDPRLE